MSVYKTTLLLQEKTKQKKPQENIIFISCTITHFPQIFKTNIFIYVSGFIRNIVTMFSNDQSQSNLELLAPFMKLYISLKIHLKLNTEHSE